MLVTNGLILTFLVLVCASNVFSQSGYGEIIKELMENVKVSQNASEECRNGINEMWASLFNGEGWAWKMLDAWSKIPSGYIEGNTRDFGHFDECINIDHRGNTNVKGKYCFSGMVTVLPAYVNFTGISINQNATSFSYSSDVFDLLQTSGLNELLKNQTLLSSLVQYPQTKTVTGDVKDLLDRLSLITINLAMCIPAACRPSDLSLLPTIYPYDGACTTMVDTQKWDTSDSFAVAIVLAVVLIMILSTIYDYYLSSAEKKPTHKIFLAYSVKTNGRMLFDTSKSAGHLLCLGGLKTVSILWVMMGHRFTSVMEVFAINANEISWIRRQVYSMYIQGAQYAVDTFLVLSGCLLAYLAIKPMTSLKNRIGRLSVFKKAYAVTSFTLIGYIHRYLRLTPPIAVIYMYYVTMARRLGSGPIHNNLIEMQREPCINNWWSFFLYVENYVHTNNMCIVHLWYLNVDMQIFLIAPFILWPIVLIQKQMLYVGLPLLTAVASVITFYVVYANEIVWYTNDYYNLYYYVTHTRLAPWFIGMILGTVLYNTKNTKIKISKTLNLAIWCVAVLAFFALVFGQQGPSYNYDRVTTSLWSGLHKPAFSLIICWIVWACENGYGGMINTFLSCSICQIIGRLSFCMYIVQFIPIVIELSSIRLPIYFSDIFVLRAFLADIFFTTSIAIFWTLAFEAPIRAIDKIIFGRKRAPREVKAHENDNPKEVSVQTPTKDNTAL